MNWYGVKVLYCARITGEPSELKLDNHYLEDDYYEEGLLLVQAESPRAAADWAAEKCKENNTTYVNRYGQTVEYSFYDWLEVDQIKDTTLHNGTVAMSATYRMPRGMDVEQIIAAKFSPCDRTETFPLHSLNMDA